MVLDHQVGRSWKKKKGIMHRYERSQDLGHVGLRAMVAILSNDYCL